MNSKDYSPTPAKVVSLKIRNQGHVPSFKNGKQLFVTNKKNKAWMQTAIHNLKSQFVSACRTGGCATSTAALRQSLTVSFPQDDNWTVIPIIILTSQTVDPGEEGCDITIERL